MPKRILHGIVVSDACDKTVVVRVERRVMHPVYKKFITRSKKYAAHDEDNRCQHRRHGADRGEPADLEAQDWVVGIDAAPRKRHPAPRRDAAEEGDAA